MSKKARRNYIKATSQLVNRKKMYKAKKQWIVAGMSFLVAMGIGATAQSVGVHASTINPAQLSVQRPAQQNNTGNIQNKAKALHNTIMNNNVASAKANVQSSASNSVKPSASSSSVSASSNVQPKGLNKLANNKPVSAVDNGKNVANYKPASVNSKFASNSVDSNVVKSASVASSSNVQPQSKQASSVASNAPESKVSLASANPVSAKVSSSAVKQVSAPNVKPFGSSSVAKVASNNPVASASAKSSVSSVGTKAVNSTSNQVSNGVTKGLGAVRQNKPLIKVADNNIVTGTYYGLNYKYDPQTKALEFTNGTLTWNGNDGKPFIGYNNSGNGSDVSPIPGMASYNIQAIKFDDDVNTSHVTNMKQMFGFNFLQSLSLGNKFNTSNVTDMSGMFSSDSNLSYLNLGNKFNTSNVTNMSNMFSGDSNLQSLTIKSPNTKINRISTKLPSMYLQNTNPTNFNDFNKGNVGTFIKSYLQTGKFRGLNYIDNTLTGNVELTSGKYKLSDGNTPNFSNSYFLREGPADFAHAKHVKFDDDVDMSNIGSDMTYMFYKDPDLQTIDLGNSFDTSHVTKMVGLFNSDTNLQQINLGSHFNTQNVGDMELMFAGLKNLDVLNLGNQFDTSKATDGKVYHLSDGGFDDDNMLSMFEGDNNLQEIDIGSPKTKFNSDAMMPQGAKTISGYLDGWYKRSNYTPIHTGLGATALMPTNLADGKSHVGDWGNAHNMPTKINTTIDFTTNGKDVIGTATANGYPATEYTVQPNQVPNGYALQNDGTQTFAIQKGSVEVTVKHEQPASIVINFMNGTNKIGTTTANSYVSNKYTVQPSQVPNGYELANDGSQAIDVQKSNTNVNVNVKPAQHVTDIVRFINGSDSSHSKVSGIAGQQGTVQAPQGTHFIDGSNGQFTFEPRKKVIFHVANNTNNNTDSSDVTDYIRFVSITTGKNVPVNGQISTSIIQPANTDYTIPNNLIPSGYKLANDGSQRFNVGNGGKHIVNVIPASATADKVTNTIKFFDQSDGENVASDNVTGNVGSDYNVHTELPAKDANLPSGYAFINNGSYIFKLGEDGDTHRVDVTSTSLKNYSDYIPVAGNMHNGGKKDLTPSNTKPTTASDQSDLVTVHEKEFDNGNYIRTVTQYVAETGRTDESYSINPDDFTPNGYAKTGSDVTQTGKFNANGVSLKDVTFNYDAQAGAPVVINYINQNGQNISSDEIDGNVDDKGNVYSDINIPKGYQFTNASDNNQNMSNATKTDIPYTVSTNDQTINVHVMGDKVNVPVKFLPENGNSTKPVASDTIPARVGDKVSPSDGDENITGSKGAKVPAGYHVVIKGKTINVSPRRLNSKKNYPIYDVVEGNSISGTATVHLVYNESNGRVDSTKDIQVPINTQVGDTNTVNSSDYDKFGYDNNNGIWTIPTDANVAPNGNNTNYKPSDTFTYTAQTAGTITIHYLDVTPGADTKGYNVVDNYPDVGQQTLGGNSDSSDAVSLKTLENTDGIDWTVGKTLAFDAKSVGNKNGAYGLLVAPNGYHLVTKDMTNKPFNEKGGTSYIKVPLKKQNVSLFLFMKAPIRHQIPKVVPKAKSASSNASALASATKSAVASADASIANSYKNSVSASVASANSALAKSYANSADKSIASAEASSVATSTANANHKLASEDATKADQSIANSEKASVANSVASANQSMAKSLAQSANNSMEASMSKSIASSTASADKSIASVTASQANSKIKKSVATSVAKSVSARNKSVANSYAKSANDSIANSYKNSVMASVSTANQSVANSVAKSANASIANSYKNSVASSVAMNNSKVASEDASVADKSIANSEKSSVADKSMASSATSAKPSQASSSATSAVKASGNNIVINPAPMISAPTTDSYVPAKVVSDNKALANFARPVEHKLQKSLPKVARLNDIKLNDVANYKHMTVGRNKVAKHYSFHHYVRIYSNIKLGKKVRTISARKLHVLKAFVIYGKKGRYVRFEVRVGKRNYFVSGKALKKHFIRKHLHKLTHHLSKRHVMHIINQLGHDK